MIDMSDTITAGQVASAFCEVDKLKARGLAVPMELLNRALRLQVSYRAEQRRLVAALAEAE